MTINGSFIILVNSNNLNSYYEILIFQEANMKHSEQKKWAGQKAAEYIKNGMILGLGTGSTAYYMIKRVGELVKNNFI